MERAARITVDFTANRLSPLIKTGLASPAWSPAGFNGPLFPAADALGIVSASADAAPPEGSLGHADGMQAASATATAVPDPATLAVPGAGPPARAVAIVANKPHG